MKRIAVLYSLITVVSAWFTCSVQAQNSNSYLNDTGAPAYGVQIPVENGFIDVSNGDLHLEFPLASPPQRGGLSVNERLVYDSRIWNFLPFGNNGSYHWWPYNVNPAGGSTTSGGWRFVSGGEVGSLSHSATTQSSTSCGSGGGEEPEPEPIAGGGPGGGTGGGGYGGPYETQSSFNFVWTDPTGTVHPTSASMSTDSNACTGSYTTQFSPGAATDGSGYIVRDDGNGSPLIVDANGNEVYPQITDRYGNYLSSDSNGNLVDDTGRTPVIRTQSESTTYYDVLAPNGPINNNGMRVRYTVTTAPVPVSTYFQQSDTYEWVSPQNGETPLLTPVQSIQMPDGSQYTFTYDGYGELSSVTLPTGGVIKYSYNNLLDSANTQNRWIASRARGSAAALTFTPKAVFGCQNYSSGCSEYVTLHQPSGDETLYELTLNNGAWNTAAYTYNGAAPTGTPARFLTSGLIVATHSTNQYSNACAGCSGANYLTNTLETTVLYNNGSALAYNQSQSAFDPTNSKITSSKEWDYSSQVASVNYSSPQSSTPARETDYSYTGFDLSQIKVNGPDGTQAGLTTYSYTTSASPTSGLPQHGGQNAGGPYLQSVAHWLDTDQAHPPTTTYTMDDSGMIKSVSDPNANPTTITYQCGNSLPYQSKNALLQTSQYSYDCSSGAATGFQDPNDLAAGRTGITYSYESQAGRLNTITRADGGTTTYSYPSSSEVGTTASTGTSDPGLVSSTKLDSYGRQSASIVGGTETDVTYDVNGRQSCVTNPFRSGTPASSCITSYDGLGRPLTQSLADGISTRSWSYNGSATTSTDEKGAAWTRYTDAFGRLTNVGEPSPNGTTQTTYYYNNLGSLFQIRQFGLLGGSEVSRYRTFTYDSLGRLICQATPETTSYNGGSGQVFCFADASRPLPVGAVTYSYDAVGNALSKTDALGTVTSLHYDALNRLKTRTYSIPSSSSVAATSGAYYGYDGNDANGAPLSASNVQSNNAIGRVSYMSIVGSGLAYSYDSQGRISRETDYLPSTQDWRTQVNAIYNQAGAVTDLTYPDGRHIHQGFNGSGQLTSSALVDVSGTPVAQTYLSSASYNPDGSPNIITFGNNVSQTITENSRLQVQSVTTAVPQSVLSGNTILSHTYCYSNCSSGGTANSGLIWGIADTLNPLRNQNFTHDSLNRINGFSTAGVSQQYGADSFGNLWGIVNNNPTNHFNSDNRINDLPCASSLPAGQPAFNATGTQNCDTDAGLVQLYTYDAENRQATWSIQGNQANPETYTYRADGLRVRKDFKGGAPFTEYIYFNGKVIAEKDQTGSFTDYVSANGGANIARISNSFPALHTSGLRDSSIYMTCGTNYWVSGAGGVGHAIQPGDRIVWNQKSINSHGGLTFQMDDGNYIAATADDGMSIFGDTNPDGTWHFRAATIPSTYSQQGRVIQRPVTVTGSDTPAGNWDQWVADVSIVGTDGTVTPILTGQNVGGEMWSACGVRNPTFGEEQDAVDPSTGPAMGTHFFVGDHLGTAQMEFTAGTGTNPAGWPIWQGLFAPFGQELDTQTTANPFRYTGLEHDAESNLEHAAFRQLSTTFGRWTSPDPYDGSMDVSNPQSFNRYSYVGNMPLSGSDPSGLVTPDLPPGVLNLGAALPYINYAIAAVEIGYDVYKYFRHAQLTASHKARPNASPWDEHQAYKPVPYTSVAQILGIGVQVGCEFGGCSFQQGTGGQSDSNIGCNTSLPDGRIVGDIVRRLRVVLTIGELSGHLHETFLAIALPHGPIDFKKKYGDKNFNRMGYAGNFAYFAIGTGFFPDQELEMGAGLYGEIAARFFKHSTVRKSDLTGPYHEDAAAALMEGPGLRSGGCSIP